MVSPKLRRYVPYPPRGVCRVNGAINPFRVVDLELVLRPAQPRLEATRNNQAQLAGGVSRRKDAVRRCGLVNRHRRPDGLRVPDLHRLACLVHHLRLRAVPVDAFAPTLVRLKTVGRPARARGLGRLVARRRLATAAEARKDPDRTTRENPSGYEPSGYEASGPSHCFAKDCATRHLWWQGDFLEEPA